MSKIHDGKLNTTPMIDEEIEKALLEAMDKETPDLWSRIMAGIDSPNSPSGFDDIMGISDEELSEFDDLDGSDDASGDIKGSETADIKGAEAVDIKGSETADIKGFEAADIKGSAVGSISDAVGDFKKASDDVKSEAASDNVVQFKSKDSNSKALRRKWTGLLVAAALIIIVAVPASRIILNQKKNSTNSEAASTGATAETAVVAEDTETDSYYTDNAIEEEVIEEESAMESENSAMSGSSAAGSEKIEGAYEAPESAATEATTAAATEAATEAFIEETAEPSESKGDNKSKNTLAGETVLNDDQIKYLGIRGYAGTFDKDKLKLIITDGLADTSIEARIVVEDGEYYLTDYVDVMGETVSEERSEDLIKILNQEDSGITELINVEGYTEDMRYRFSVKYPEKNNKNEVEIVEIFSIE